MTATKDTITQPLPTAGAGATFGHLDWESTTPSLTNPRKHFDQETLQEMAVSITASGVHTPILVRPLPEHRVAEEQAKANAEKRERAAYEIVAGERRWRACGLANKAPVPAMIRNMTDAQALEAQVIENLQREDISKLEEAEGYRALMDETGMTAEEIGAKVGKGKSRAYIYSVLKVLDLCDEGQEALRQGDLDFSSALSISRIATPELQREALEWAVDEDYSGDKPSARAVMSHVKSHFMLDLRKASFSRKDADLCPAAGPCTTCPNRSGANQEEDSKGADVCTNPPCFKAKEQAHTDQLRKQAQESGCEVLDEKQAKQLIGSYYNDFNGVPGYKRLDSQRDSPIEGKTLRKAIGAKVMEQSGIKPTLITNPNNPKELIHCVTAEQVVQLLQMAGHSKAKEQLIAEAKERDLFDAKAAQKQATEDYERNWRMDVLQDIVKRLQHQEQEALHPRTPAQVISNRLAAQRLAAQLNGDDSKLLCKLLDLGKVAPKDAIKQAANEWHNPELLTGCIIALHDRGYWSTYDLSSDSYVPRQNPQLIAMAEACGVDMEAAKAKAQANMRAADAEKAAATTVKPEAPKPDLPLTPAARTNGGVGKGKAKKTKGPAALAGGGRDQLTADEASASIAQAMQALEESDQGADAQGNVAEPVAADAAQAQPPLVTLKKSKLATPSANTPAAAGTGESADDGQGSEDARTGAAVKKVLTPGELLANRVIVQPNATGKKQKIYIGDEGTVVAILGDAAVDVSFPGPKGCKPVRVGFHVTELEIAP